MGVGDYPDTLADFFKQSNSSEWSLQIINRTGPEPIKRMVEDLFGNLSTQV